MAAPYFVEFRRPFRMGDVIRKHFYDHFVDIYVEAWLQMQANGRTADLYIRSHGTNARKQFDRTYVVDGNNPPGNGGKSIPRLREQTVVNDTMVGTN